MCFNCVSAEFSTVAGAGLYYDESRKGSYARGDISIEDAWYYIARLDSYGICTNHTQSTSAAHIYRR